MASRDLPLCPYRAVAFDFDGLLFNTEELYLSVTTEILHRRGLRIQTGLLEAMRGRPNLIALGILVDWYGLNATPETLLAEPDQLFEPLLKDTLAPMPGAARLLDRLDRAGIPKAVVSSGRRSFVLPILERYGWVERFAFVLTADDVTQGKPHPEPYRLATARFGLRPAEVLALEDSPHGCESAAAAGNGVVAVTAAEVPMQAGSNILFVARTLLDCRISVAMGLDS